MFPTHTHTKVKSKFQSHLHTSARSSKHSPMAGFELLSSIIPMASSRRPRKDTEMLYTSKMFAKMASATCRVNKGIHDSWDWSRLTRFFKQDTVCYEKARGGLWKILYVDVPATLRNFTSSIPIFVPINHPSIYQFFKNSTQFH